ncbi:MAG: indolepyruvate ferredoxin oxidoreductase subunit alpha [Clostridiales bacterium]|nr:indolepyruvate ferredoxin oxidoreductase subunit alpha [Clostridiales bacterium]MCF8022523.1 indolepyruvate ferredoxin oxidoreductase subunit alpha [Clostridiales bacterium]
MKNLLSGNAAIARGAYEAGVILAAGYPGTPSTEILENLSRYKNVYSEWAPNEKVALEVALGSSFSGARSLVTMKHVGVNVAADPLLTSAYTGVNGGLVLVSADDPGMHSSQNEQDNRRLAALAKLPVLEPASSQEAKEMVLQGFEISEKYDIPVILRITTRIAHSQGYVLLKDPVSREVREYNKNPRKNLMVPGYARMRRIDLDKRVENLRLYSEDTPVNCIEGSSSAVGIITSGVSYQYVKEVLPNTAVFKLGMTNPLPVQRIKEFAGSVEKLYIVEELEPFIEEQLQILGINATGKDLFPNTGEFSPGLLRSIFARAGVLEEDEHKNAEIDDAPAVPGRPPVLCPGCPHRGVFYTLRKMKLSVTGDIGCYTLGGLPPIEGIDSCVCMGASIGMAHGAEKVSPVMKDKTVAVIGDSTFMHSGITGLLNLVYNKGTSTVIILDNRTTAMTGHQDHPATGCTLMGEKAPELDIEALCRALGVNRVNTVDPLDLSQLKETIKNEIDAAEPSVIIARRPCALLSKEPVGPRVEVDLESCEGCGACLKLGCPAISMQEDKASVDPFTCNGCGICIQVCKFGALVKGGNSSV